MRWWRLSQYPGLDGIGGLHVSGRWHSKGRPILYVAEHPALAMAETMAHLKLKASAIPTTYKLICIEVDDGASMDPAPALPAGWQANEPTTQALGDAWLMSAGSLLMKVPSAVLDHSTNCLINPLLPEMANKVREVSVEPFWFDKRYFK